MKLLRFLVMTIFLVSCVSEWGYPAAAIFSGSDVKILKQNLDMNGQAKVLTGTDDPTSVAKDAPIGSLYMDLTNGNVYKKLDAGSTTAWEKVASGDQFGLNQVDNPGFEVNTSDWSASGGTFTRTTTAANVLAGVASGSWDASAGSQTLTSTAKAVTEGLKGVGCEIDILYKGGDANLTLQVWDGSSALASQVLAVSTNATRQRISFTCPTSGNMQVRLISSADAAVIYIDQVRIGLNEAEASVSNNLTTPSLETVEYVAEVDCSTASNVISHMGDTLVATVGNISSGNCSFTINSVFGTSNRSNGEPYCVTTVVDDTTQAVTMQVEFTSATAGNFICQIGGSDCGAVGFVPFVLRCIGPKP